MNIETSNWVGGGSLHYLWSSLWLPFCPLPPPIPSMIRKLLDGCTCTMYIDKSLVLIISCIKNTLPVSSLQWISYLLGLRVFLQSKGVLNCLPGHWTDLIWLTCLIWNPPSTPSLSEGGDSRRGIGRGWLINIPFSAISSPLFPYLSHRFFKQNYTAAGVLAKT